MELIDSIWQVAVIALLAGALIGVLAYRFLSPSVKQSDGLKSELDQAQRELSDYRTNVNSHFAKTSELVNDLTQNYVKVYQHLAEGAQTLGDSRALNNLLEQQQGKVLLSVDDASDTAEAIAGGTQPETVSDPEAPAKTAGYAEERVAATGGDETLPQDREEDSTTPETAAPPTDPETPPEERKQTSETAQASATEDETGSGEPVLDVSRIDARDAAAAEDESKSGVAAVIPEPEDTEAAKPTRH